MKNRKSIFATVFSLVLAVSIIAASAATAFANGKKNTQIETMPEIVETNTSGECAAPSFESFVKEFDFLTEQERAALLADLAELARLEKQIDDIYNRMNDKNADKLYAEIDAIDEKITAVLERNNALLERVSDEYDEKIAANETDMTLEINEADLNDGCEDEYEYEEFVKRSATLTEQERAVLLADLADLARLEKQIDDIYNRMNDENTDKLYAEIDAIEEQITSVLERNNALWERVSDEYDEKIAANEPDMAF